MALEGQAGIGDRHAAAVVDHLDAGAAGIDDDDIDGLGAGIDGILHQFLDDRGGALDDLAGGYLVGYAIGKKGYYVGHGDAGYALKIKK
jgi:hypothetical protein